jgi:riboflavin kinase/FMN adenylyltransferase
LAAFESLGLSQVILIDFSQEFSRLNGWEFLERLEDRGKAVFLAIGDKFRCGFQRDTGADFIREMNERKGIPTEVISQVTAPDGAGSVSSSRIRSAVLSGDIARAAVLAGRNIELDLSDVRPGFEKREGQNVFVYDLCSVHRIVPAAGQYSVLMYPGGLSGLALTENGKVFLPKEAESLVFKEYPI